MRILPRILLCLIAAAASIIGMMAAAQASMFDLVSDGDFSSWGMSDVAFPFLPGEGAYADYGCFPLGNGRIFGHLGVDSDFSLLRGLTGPGYQTRGDNGDWQVWQEGNWPDIALSFKATAPKGPHQPVFHLGDKWTTQSIEQLRGAAIVRVKQSADFGELTIMQYAVPDMPVLIREYSFVPVEGVELSARTGIDEAMIERVVHAFYARVREDALLGPIFDARVRDWDAHLAKMCDFWSSVTLLTGRYTGPAMQKHLPLPVDSRHFDHWLELFGETVEALCPPAAAARFRERAGVIAASLETGVAAQNGVRLDSGERLHRPDEEVWVP